MYVCIYILYIHLKIYFVVHLPFLRLVWSALLFLSDARLNTLKPFGSESILDQHSSQAETSSYVLTTLSNSKGLKDVEHVVRFALLCLGLLRVQVALCPRLHQAVRLDGWDLAPRHFDFLSLLSFSKFQALGASPYFKKQPIVRPGMPASGVWSWVPASEPPPWRAWRPSKRAPSRPNASTLGGTRRFYVTVVLGRSQKTLRPDQG